VTKKTEYDQEKENNKASLMRQLGYEEDEIYEMIMNRREKYNIYESKFKKCRSIMTEAEKKRIEIQKEIEEHFQKYRNEMIPGWKMIKSNTFGQDPQKMFNYMTQHINGKRLSDKEKKDLNKHHNDVLKNNLGPMWNYNMKRANTIVNEGYSINDIAAIMNQLSLHYDIETPVEHYYFKDLDWDITIPK
jgi:hypothetical protein